MLGALHYVFGEILPGVDAVELAEADAGDDDALEVAVELGLGQKALLDGLGDGLIRVSAFHIYPIFDGKRRRLRLGLHVLVAALDIEVRDRPAVGDDNSLITPLSAQDRIDQIVACAAWLAFECIICGHYLLHSCLGHKVLECGKIGLVEIAPRRPGVETVPVRLRPGVHCVVLGAGE